MIRTYSKVQLENILAKAFEGERPAKPDIRTLLSMRDPDPLDMLFRTARSIRCRHFGSRVFLYGFLYFSTHCRNNCTFCHFRHHNASLPRYRKTADEVVSAALAIADSGIHLLDLTMGEDPAYLQTGGDTENPLCGLVEAVRKATGLPLMVSPGRVSDRTLARLADIGADWYACYQETHNPLLFDSLRIGQNFDTRMEVKRTAQKLGMFIEEGILCGVGETLDDIADSICKMRDQDADQVRVMSFVPQEGAPLAGGRGTDPLRELVTLAVMRLVLPDRLIPASLDVDGLSGLKARLDSGANVITSLIPPGNGLAGVANSSLDIEDSRRTVAGVMPVLTKCGLEPATLREYRDWLSLRHQRKHAGEDDGPASFPSAGGGMAP